MAASETDNAARYEDMRTLFVHEAVNKSVPFIFHDSYAHRDNGLRRLVRDEGMIAYGRYWLLVELLTGLPAHQYEVADDIGWEMLALDMSALEPMSAEECRAFVGKLASHDLVSAEALGECIVMIPRVTRDIQNYAEDIARKKLGAWKRHYGSAGK